MSVLATGGGEWRAAWPLPFVSMIGMSGATMFAYSSGVFLQPMTAELGWSRTQFSFAFMLQMMVTLIYLPVIGRLVDRFGARRMALIGVLSATLGMSLLALAQAPIWTWWVFCLLQVLLAGPAAPPVWVSAVVKRFERSRGLALAIALAGVGLGMGLWPLVAATGVQTIGWRATFPAIAVGWAVVMLPLTILFFRDVRRGGPAYAQGKDAPPFRYRDALKSRTFLCLASAGGLYAIISFGMTLHLVPLLRDNGITLTEAAGLAGLVGVFSIVGRIGTGFLLDRVSVRALGVFVFLLPILVALLLWQESAALAAVAIAILGLAGGAETDIVTYLAARRFARQGFASVYSVITAIFSMSAAVGPLLAGFLYDRFGSYQPFLIAIVPIVSVAALLVWLVPSAEEAAPPLAT